MVAPPTQPALVSVPPDWEQLVRTHDRTVRLALIARGIPAQLARECTQEAWLKLIENHRAGKLDEIKLPGLAIRQALFLARSALRKRSEEPMPELEPVASTRFEEQLQDRNRLALAMRALSKRSPRDQQLFVATLNGTPTADIASSFHLSIQRARQIVCEVRSALRTAVEDK